MFRISDFIEFDAKGRAVCPSCASEGKGKKNLSLIPDTDGAYKCHRGCTSAQIREALGAPKDQQLPAALATMESPKASTVSPQQVKAAHDHLMRGPSFARQWLTDRGISEEMIARYQLGLVQSMLGGKRKPAISIPIPANAEGTAYFQKKRVEPWVDPNSQPAGYSPWVQKGIPAKVWFTYLPAEARETWLCEGEWDAMMLGWQVRKSELPVAVATFTCGCSSIPPQSELELLPGNVVIFYDRNDKPLKNGTKPGEKGAIKLAQALGDRGKVGLVPMPSNCTTHGWDVSDALRSGFDLTAFLEAARDAEHPTIADSAVNPLRPFLIWNDELLDTAPEYTDWLVADLLTTNELFLLAAGPRSGKSLLAMTLARSVASGEPFLDRPVLKGPVIYIRKEDGDAKTKEREIAQGWARGLPVAWLKKFKLSDVPHLAQLAQGIKPRLIVIDTLSRVKDSNISESSAEMSQLLEPLQELAEDLDCCVLLVHHTGKISVDNAATIDIFDTIRGSSAIRATCRGSLVLAAGERNYRLFAENGWGKHDLNVVLDANTLTWKLLGKWNPSIAGSQTEQVLDYLKSHQIATIDQMSADLGCPKKSLYKTLERLQASDIAGEKVVKEGQRRSYTYRLALFDVTQTLFDTIRQGNSVSNSANSDTARDEGLYSTKNNISFLPEGSIIDQTVTCDNMIDDRSESQVILSNIEGKTGSNPDAASVSPIRQLFDKKTAEAENAGSERVVPIRQLFDNYSTTTSKRDPISVGCLVEVLEGRLAGSRATVIGITEAGVEVQAPRWAISRTYPPDQVRVVKPS